MKSQLLGGARRSAAAYDEELRSMRRRTLVVLYMTYACFYLSRKADSVVKIALHEEEGFSVEDLAMLDTVYLSVYTGSTMALAASGLLSGWLDSSKFLCTALMCLAITSWLKSRARTPTEFAAYQVLHAFFQSAGWPTCIKLVGIWVTENRGFVMGIWTTCQSLGGILGALWATWFMSHYSWSYSYLYHVPLMVAMGIVCYFTIRDDPPNRDDEDDDEDGDDLPEGPTLVMNDNNRGCPGDMEMAKRRGRLGSTGSRSRAGSFPGTEEVTLYKVLHIPGVVWILISYFFLKFLRYALLMWLPYYYEEGLHFDQSLAGYMSSCFELGGMIGTPFIGWFSDQVLQGRRDLTAAWFLSGASIMLMACVLVSAAGVTLNAVCMFLVGILVIGPDSIISGTIAQDLGVASSMGNKAIGTLAGLINSVGSCGAIFQSYATAYISRVYGWSVLFTIFVACSMWSACILFAVAHRNRGEALSGITSQKTSMRIVTVCASIFVLYMLALSGSQGAASAASK
ncbi:Glucose-6-phosphate exchanger SLC37A2 [Hondaea fermentalgiana]|uniref:Glucose-6-phosphate exchanger SLC37A2 n=1 Tax=Hondaea fermentalgiana TaxID=2315210 RepID=A0A2R5GMY6_9STRA|nr:Glucose-6-phosphate exchanger SLC37A2 [Hondaea fermentalgiana]|eukprot:GBG32256.1 Glucose-6-phosphate exchanger SLC37A2 [Hondaea fermentalgiana]